jgi:hypothetical protein
MVEWKPEDFEEGATIFMSHWNRIIQKGSCTKEDMMEMLADVANAMELAEDRRQARNRAEYKVNSSASTITIPVGSSASTW